MILPRWTMALVSLLLVTTARGRADEEPKKWEQLFFPFPIVGAPPQLEQQVQVFVDVFTGNKGGGVVPSAEIAYIASPHLGFVATVPYQVGFRSQPTGFQDIELLAQYLAAGSLWFDDQLSIGAQVTAPSAQHGLGSGDLLFGPFLYAGQRFWHHVILELNLTALVPVIHGETARQILLNGLVSTLVTPRHFKVPVYVQVEEDATFFLDGTSGLPGGATAAPVETLSLAPEVFVGPLHGMRAAAGVFFNVLADPEHEISYWVTFSIDIPNRFGY